MPRNSFVLRRLRQKPGVGLTATIHRKKKAAPEGAADFHAPMAQFYC
jgi:hypothetical protein